MSSWETYIEIIDYYYASFTPLNIYTSRNLKCRLKINIYIIYITPLNI